MTESIEKNHYDNLIFLGAGENSNLEGLLSSALNVWLIDASEQIVAKIKDKAFDQPRIHIQQALIDINQQSRKFYEYNFSWASGIFHPDEDTLRLYPRLRCLSTTQQTSTSINDLVNQCLIIRCKNQKDDNATISRNNLLILDLGRQTKPLIDALDEENLFKFSAIILLPEHHSQYIMSAPSCLQGPLEMPEVLSWLPENSRYYVRHPLIEKLHTQEKRQIESEQRVHSLNEKVEKLTEQRDERSKQLEETLNQNNLNIEALRLEREQSQKHLQTIKQFQRQISEQKDQNEKQHEQLKALQQAVENYQNKYNSALEQLSGLSKNIDESIKQRDDALHQNHLNFVAFNSEKSRAEELVKERALIKSQLIALRKQNQSLQKMFDAAQEKSNKTKKKEVAKAKKISNLEKKNGFYRAFEDRFRGSRELIKQRVGIYLSFIKPVAERYPDVKALDLGCGRGEWLEILQQSGISYEGVDIDDTMLEDCYKLGLDVTRCDALDYLNGLPDASRISISLIHFVEIVPFDFLRSIVEQAKRVLVPEGLLIMETPNPENYTVGACNFYMDPSHRNPIPPSLLAFVPDFYGFQRIKILRMNETQDEIKGEIVDFLQNISPDYAVIAQVCEPSSDIQTEEEREVWKRDYGISFSTIVEKRGMVNVNE